MTAVSQHKHRAARKFHHKIYHSNTSFKDKTNFHLIPVSGGYYSVANKKADECFKFNGNDTNVIKQQRYSTLSANSVSYSAQLVIDRYITNIHANSDVSIRKISMNKVRKSMPFRDIAYMLDNKD